MKKPVLLLCSFLSLASCKPAQNDGANQGDELRSFNQEEFNLFSSDLKNLSKWENNLAKNIDLNNCNKIEYDYSQKGEWLEKSLQIGSKTKGSCPYFSLYKIRKSPLADGWESTAGFSLLNQNQSEQEGIHSFFLKWSGLKKDKLKISGEGFWFPRKNERILIFIESNDEKTTLKLFYTKFKVVISVDRSDGKSIYKLGPDQSSEQAIQDLISNFGMALENINF